MYWKCDKFANKRSCCPSFTSVVRIGTYYRKSDSKYIQRWKCKGCKKTFSQATNTPCFGQNKRRVNTLLLNYLGKTTSLRDCAKLLKISRNTVAKKAVFLAEQCELSVERQLEHYKSFPIDMVQFDEMETFEHTKLKPLSIALAVHSETREVLGVEVSVMPAKGHLAKASREKYGPRPDHRATGMKQLFKKIDPYVASNAIFRSDKNPRYPCWLKSHSENWRHETVKGQRGSIVGGGELKKVKFDPIFSLNHTCAMFRAKVSRLLRRTWNTTKRPDRLQSHLYIYAAIHNEEIQKNLEKKLVA